MGKRVYNGSNSHSHVGKGKKQKTSHNYGSSHSKFLPSSSNFGYFPPRYFGTQGWKDIGVSDAHLNKYGVPKKWFEKDQPEVKGYLVATKSGVATQSSFISLLKAA